LSSEEFKSERYQDEYRERFLAMIDQKVKGQEIMLATPAPERRGKVVDLMAALKQSLKQTGPRQRQAARKPARKTARKRRKAQA